MDASTYYSVGNEACCFNSLPVELMESVFCQLPMVDLMLSCRLVCRQWNEVISNEKFIPWKKRYCRLKKKDKRAERDVFQIMDQADLWREEFFAVNLAKFMAVFRKEDTTLLQFLTGHPKYPIISKFLENTRKSQQMQVSEEEQSCWSVVGLLTLVSTSVKEITLLIRCMQKSSSCLVQDVLECLYCLATVFYVLLTQHRVKASLHYNVFYALYLFENSFAATRESLNPVFSHKTSGQQLLTKYRCSSDKVRLTHEQLRFVKHEMNPGDVIKIVAFAGTGKTTTLVEYTKFRPRMNFLNVAYNKSIQLHAVKVFPANVKSQTIHSLAYRHVGFRFRSKLRGSLQLSSITKALPDGGYLHARRVVDTLQNFVASADPCVNAEHVPRWVPPAEHYFESHLIPEAHEERRSYFNSPKYIQQVVDDVKTVWQKMIKPADPDICMTHDGYLKLYQLEKPEILGFDCLLIDEAQDCTPAASDVLLRQSCARVLVGDPHQQIYGFRGAKNAMGDIQANHVFYLTQSFRFGPEIANIAACTLGVLKGVHDKTLVGSARPGTVCGGTVGQLAIITRCNHTLFNEAVRVCCANNNARVAFAGGLESYNLNKVLDIYRLFTQDKTKHSEIRDKFIKTFSSFSKLKTFATTAEDAELLGKIKIVETHHVNLPTRVEKIRSKACKHMEQATVVLSTAHKAKGLEFDSVRVTDDFLMGGEVPLHELLQDEKNLVYVAVTRAKKSLVLNSTLLRLLKECFIETALPNFSSEGGSTIICVQCLVGEAPSPQSSVVVQKRITLGQGATPMSPGRILCSSCALREAPHLSGLIIPPPSPTPDDLL